MSRTAKGAFFFGALESLRGIAALMVALYHAAWNHPLYEVGIVRNSYLMVDFFFVLSGFVICHSYGHRITNGISAARFVVLRLGRLYPLHLASLLFFAAFECIKFAKNHYTGHIGSHAAFEINNGGAFLLNLLLLQSVGILKAGTFNAPSWSICVEFWTYIVFGLVCLMVGSGKKRVLVALGLGALSFGILMHFGQFSLSVDNRYALPRCILGFFFGVLTYEFFTAFATRLEKLASRVALMQLAQAGILLALALFLSASLKRTMTDYLGLPLFALIILAFAVGNETPIAKFLLKRPCAHLGKISYSIYMVHFAVMTVMLNIIMSIEPARKLNFDKELAPDMGAAGGLIALIVYLAAIIWISRYTFRWIEAPFRDKAKAFVARRLGPARTPAAEPGLP